MSEELSGSDADSGAHTLSFASTDHDSRMPDLDSVAPEAPGAVRVYPVAGTEIRLSKGGLGGQGTSDNDTSISTPQDEAATELVEATLVVDENDTRVEALRQENQALRQTVHWLEKKATPNGHHQGVPRAVKKKGDAISSASSVTMSVFSTCDAEGDSGIYTGVVVHSTGMPHGVGRMEYKDGRIYVGEWYVFS
jgi:hypothetical protein